jgi:membrane fusion protein (multidrug efflux system)
LLAAEPWAILPAKHEKPFVIKRFVIAFVLVVLVCGGLVGFNLFRAKAIQQFFATMRRPAVTVSATDVAPSAWTPGIEAFGTVYAAEGIDIAVQVGGIVKSIAFKANEAITAGQLLVQIDDAVERADLPGAQSAATLDQDALARARELAKTGVNPTVSVDQAETQLELAGSQLAKIEATLDQKAIKAPFAGVVGIPRVDLGQWAQPGTIVATLQNLDRMKVDFTVPEQAVASLTIGQPAVFGVSEDQMKFRGTVTGVDPKIDPKTRLVSVQALLDNKNDELRPGQFIRIRVELPEEKSVIAIPQTAVTPSLYGDFVFAVEEAKPPAGAAGLSPPAAGQAPPAAPSLVARQVFVKTGRRNGGLIEVVEGLNGGEKIVTAGENRLSNGTPVTIDNTIDPAKLAIGK